MNTKTMRLPPRRVLTSNNKRKDREGFDSLKPSPPPPPPAPALSKLHKPVFPIGSAKLSEPDSVAVSSNQLLAGYLAHEFLTKGTLFGQQWDPDGAESATSGLEWNDIYDNSNKKKKIKPSRKGKESEPSTEKGNYQKYVEVSSLLKGGEGGAHLPGVFNPSQLASILQT